MSPNSAKHAKLLVCEHSSGSYSPRTYANARAGELTVAIAKDFFTAGERLTKKAAGECYVGIPIYRNIKEGGEALLMALREHNVSTLNVAGNGIYTLTTGGYDQAATNMVVFGYISYAHARHPISKIVSGGQTGVDQAGIVAAIALGIDAVATLPKGFLRRNAAGIDYTTTSAALEAEFVQQAREMLETLKTGMEAKKAAQGPESAIQQADTATAEPKPAARPRMPIRSRPGS